MTENQEFINESIYDQVRMGFLSFEEIKENIIEEIEDNGFEEEISNDWAIEKIENEFKSLTEESKNWKKPTDTEKLVKAFDELCKNNIIALHKAGYTSGDGHNEAVEVERSLRKQNVISDGYCFYHEQDLARAIQKENPSLYIAFQKVDNESDEVTIAVGKQIVATLNENGLETEWEEVPNKRILIPNFKWQLLYDENNRDLEDYEKTLELLIQAKN